MGARKSHFPAQANGLSSNWIWSLYYFEKKNVDRTMNAAVNMPNKGPAATVSARIRKN